MRLFTALDVPKTLRDQLADLQQTLDLDARWTPPEQFHITLRFIGEVDSEQAQRYETSLAKVAPPPAHCAPQTPTALGVLPSARSPRVVICEFERTESLMGLYRTVSEALEAEGLDPEERTYRPHVTIARLDNPDPEHVHSTLRSHEDVSPPPFEAERFTLYESTLTPEGAVHDPQAIFPLTR